MKTDLQTAMNNLSRRYVGFDPLFDEVFSTFRVDPLANITSTVTNTKYPPYNLIKIDEDNYRISLALAGFSKEELEVTVEGGLLEVKASKAEKEDENLTYLHRGIGTRSFTRTFRLGEYMEVGEITFVDGILSIEIYRHVPEAMKPKRIEIK